MNIFFSSIANLKLTLGVHVGLPQVGNRALTFFKSVTLCCNQSTIENEI